MLLSILLCISDARETSLSRPNTAYAERQIALRSLIGDGRRPIAQLAAAVGRLFFAILRAFFL
jgi:hypothetical protein